MRTGLKRRFFRLAECVMKRISTALWNFKFAPCSHKKDAQAIPWPRIPDPGFLGEPKQHNSDHGGAQTSGGSNLNF